VLVDETRDLSKTEQVSIIGRHYINSVVYERSLGFKAASQSNAQSLFKCMTEMSTRNKIDLKMCVSHQTYDGANVISENCTGVRTDLFREEAAKAHTLYTYTAPITTDYICYR